MGIKQQLIELNQIQNNQKQSNNVNSQSNDLRIDMNDIRDSQCREYDDYYDQNNSYGSNDYTTGTAVHRKNQKGDMQNFIPAPKEKKGGGSFCVPRDKLKVKIICIILSSLLFGIIFTGVMNYFLAILLSDHISENTTTEIGKVQIDFTRSMGLHYGNAYVNLIQQETDKTQKIYNRLVQITNIDWTTDHDFTPVTQNGFEFTICLSSPTASCTPAVDKNKMLWISSYDKQGITDLDNFNQQLLKKILTLFPMFRVVQSDVDLKTITITLFSGIEISYPAQKNVMTGYYSMTNNQQMFPHKLDMKDYNDYENTKTAYENSNSRIYFNYRMSEIDNLGTKYQIIIVTQCIAILCGDLNLDKSPYCLDLNNQTIDPIMYTKYCQNSPTQYCGSICTYYVKFTLSFLRSLEGKGINHVTVTQLDKSKTEVEVYKPLVFLDFKQMEVKSNFWMKEFGVTTYTQSNDAMAFYEKFDRYYKNVDNEYLATSSFSNGSNEYQISIFSIRQKLAPSLQGTNGAQGNMAFTAITQIPKSSEIFLSTITDIKDSMESLLIIGIVVLIIISLLIVCYISCYSDHVIKPINLLKDRVKQIAQGRLDVTVANETNNHWQEIDTLFKSFEFLNQIVRSGDDNYYEDMSAETLIKYSNAYMMFEKLDNRKGMGIVLNNMGNINMKLERIEEAINCYKQAFQLAERDLLELILVDNIFAFYEVRPFKGWQSTVKYDFTYNYHFYTKMMNRPQQLVICTANKGIYETIISNRAYQLANAYLQGYYSNTTFLKKMTSRSVFSKLKLSQALAEKSQYFSSKGDYNNSDSMAIESLATQDQARDQLYIYQQRYNLFDENFKNDIPPEILSQHCSLQMGNTFLTFKKYKSAISEFTDCLRQGKYYDPSVREQCLKNIQKILQQENLLEKTNDLTKLIQNNFEKRQKDIVIILDFSFSMQHKIPKAHEQVQNTDQNRINPRNRYEDSQYIEMDSQKNIALDKFLNIFDDYVQNNDRVAFISFNENVDVIFELNEKGNNTKFLRNCIESQKAIQPAGESAVRQAIYTAYKLFQKAIPKDHSKWIVVFTDGGDSCSKISEPELLNILGNSDVNVMVVGCGLDKYATKIYRQLCEKTRNGIFIKTNNKQSEINIAFQAITNKIYGNSDLNFNVEAFL